MVNETPGGAPLRVGQFSAFLGDRAGAMGPLLDDGVDVLTGDYLAELTMLVLAKNQQRGKPGYAVPFVKEFDRFAARIAAGGVKVVTNAGGLDPAGCGQAVREVIAAQGLDLTVAVVTGDDLRDAVGELTANGHTFGHLDGGEPLPVTADRIVTANAYLGAWPIVEALARGADIVICPRVTDASLVVGPAAWHFGWARDDWDRLAGALWAGHAIECGAQVTGGCFSFFHEYEDLGVPAMPIAEIDAGGDSVITKASAPGGVVTVDTVKAQLVYEVASPIYGNPDVFADLSTVEVTQEGENRVRIHSATGYPPGEETKVSLCYEGGFRNTVTIGLTGAFLDEKLAWLRRQVEAAIGGPDRYDAYRVSVVGPVSQHHGDHEGSTAWVSFTVRGEDRNAVGRAGFSDPITQIGVSNFPGFYMVNPPRPERQVAVQWPCLLDKAVVPVKVQVDGEETGVKWCTETGTVPDRPPVEGGKGDPTRKVAGHREVVLGRVFGFRSGDKGGNANLGVWARNDEGYAWLREFLSVDTVRRLLPELADLRIDRFELPGIRALNFVVYEYLELGVSACSRIDPQAKGLGEYLGSKIVWLPGPLAGSGPSR